MVAGLAAVGCRIDDLEVDQVERCSRQIVAVGLMDFEIADLTTDCWLGSVDCIDLGLTCWDGLSVRGRIL